MTKEEFEKYLQDNMKEIYRKYDEFIKKNGVNGKMGMSISIGSGLDLSENGERQVFLSAVSFDKDYNYVVNSCELYNEDDLIK